MIWRRLFFLYAQFSQFSIEAKNIAFQIFRGAPGNQTKYAEMIKVECR